MADIGTFCIDQVQGSPVTWVDAVITCTANGKRLCTDAEWVTACNATGKGLQTMTGNYEWVAELVSATSAKKRGYTDCTSASNHDVTSGGYEVRCCYTPNLVPTGMADFTTFRIYQTEGPLQTWVAAASSCMVSGKRLCLDTEWTTACAATGKGMQTMTGAWEWIAKLASATTAKKRGDVDCSSLSASSVTEVLDSHDTRCCHTP